MLTVFKPSLGNVKKTDYLSSSDKGRTNCKRGKYRKTPAKSGGNANENPNFQKCYLKRCAEESAQQKRLLRHIKHRVLFLIRLHPKQGLFCRKSAQTSINVYLRFINKILNSLAAVLSNSKCKSNRN